MHTVQGYPCWGDPLDQGCPRPKFTTLPVQVQVPAVVAVPVQVNETKPAVVVVPVQVDERSRHNRE